MTFAAALPLLVAVPIIAAGMTAFARTRRPWTTALLLLVQSAQLAAAIALVKLYHQIRLVFDLSPRLVTNRNAARGFAFTTAKRLGAVVAFLGEPAKSVFGLRDTDTLWRQKSVFRQAHEPAVRRLLAPANYYGRNVRGPKKARVRANHRTARKGGTNARTAGTNRPAGPSAPAKCIGTPTTTS